VLRALSHDPILIFVTAVFALFILLAAFGPLVWRADPVGVNLNQTLQSPSLQHPFGTDDVGRDVLARFQIGARISLIVGIVVVILGAILGGLVGLVAGALGSWIDNLLMRIMDALLSFPPLILAMMVTVGLGAGLQTAALGIILTSVPYYARILRSEVLRVRSLDFIQGAVALGASRQRIMFRHILPNALSTVLVQASAVFGYAILTLAALGFVGLGAQIPTPEWGAMITEGQSYFLTGGWWIGVFPGLGLLIAVTAANLLADRIRDLLDPRGGYFGL
jgi:peptide/nickel transport system permease protein